MIQRKVKGYRVKGGGEVHSSRGGIENTCQEGRRVVLEKM